MSYEPLYFAHKWKPRMKEAIVPYSMGKLLALLAILNYKILAYFGMASVMKKRIKFRLQYLFLL